jgi:predicted nuclease of predicted toxin-antitoxin system
MRVKVDEDLPTAIVHALRQQGHDATGVLEQGMGGWKDPELWRAVQSHGQFLVTGDKGFGDLRAYPPGSHGGILLLRPDEDGIRPLLVLLDLVLKSHRLEALTGMLILVTSRGVRLRRAGV